MSRKMSRRSWRLLAGLMTGGFLATMAWAPPASAGTSCSVLGCSETFNDSGSPATAIRNWTCSSGTTGTLSTGCASGATYFLVPGAHTPSNQDWDVLQIDAGWCYKVTLHVPGKTWVMRYDRRGTSAAHVKVEDFGSAHVNAQSTSGCP